MRLHPTLSLSPQPRETPVSYCSRVARKHGRTARQFADDCGIRFQDIVDGDANALAALAEACGVGTSHFSNSTVRRVTDRLFAIGNEQLTGDSLRRAQLRACPQCLLEDRLGPDGALAAHMRVEWLVEAVRVCPRHNLPLDVISAGPQQTHDFAWHLQRMEDRPAPSVTPAHRESGALIGYIIDRLAGRADGHWLDRMPLYAAIKSAEIVGAAITRGIKASWNSLSDADWHAAGIAGFDLLTGGDDAFRAYLARVQRDHAESSWGVKVVFGQLYNFLAQNTQDAVYEPLRGIMRSQILETVQIPAGDVVLGVKIERRRLHSIHSASRETGLHPKPLRRKLMAFGIIDSLAEHLTDDRVVFDADEALAALESVKTSMSLEGAAVYLNIPRPYDRTVLAPPFITAVSIPSPRGGHRLAFLQQDLDALLARLTSGASDRGPGDLGYVWLGEASKRCVKPMLDILTLMFDNKLTRVRLNPLERGFKAILVNLEEVRRHVYPARTTLSLRDVEHRLKASTHVVKALVDRGHLPSSLEINPISNLPSRVVRADDMDVFVETYVPLMGLAKEHGVHFRALKARLTSEGVEPAFDPQAVHATFYRRTAASAVVAAADEP